MKTPLELVSEQPHVDPVFSAMLEIFRTSQDAGTFESLEINGTEMESVQLIVKAFEKEINGTEASPQV